MDNKNTIMAFIGMALLLLLTGCDNARTMQDTHDIGWIGALSGSATQWGEPALRAATIAVEDINSQGGIDGKPLRLLVEDSESSGKMASTAATKLIHQSSVNIVFTHSSTESIAVAPIAESAGVILFASATSTPDLTDAGDYVFRVTPVNREGELLADTINKGNYTRIAILTEQAKYAIPIRDALLRDLEKVVVLDEQFSGEPDVSTILLKIKESGADTIVILPFGLDGILDIIRKMKETGLDIQVLGNAAFNTPGIIGQLGNITEGIKFTTLDIDETDPRVADFTEEYERRYGSIPNKAHTLDAATKVYIIADALKFCGEDADCIKEYLYDIKERKTVSGTLTINEDGDADKLFVMAEIRGGEILT